MLVCPFSHFLAFLWGCLSYFLDYVDRDIRSKMLVCQCFMRLKTFQSALRNSFTLPAVCATCAHTLERKNPKI